MYEKVESSQESSFLSARAYRITFRRVPSLVAHERNCLAQNPNFSKDRYAAHERKGNHGPRSGPYKKLGFWAKQLPALRRPDLSNRS